MRRKTTATLLAILLVTLQALSVYAAEPKQAEPPKKMRTTAYCTGHTTASGTPVRYGVAAVDKSHMGCTAIVYARGENGPGEVLGIFECEDTGKGADSDGDGIGAVEAGWVIDIYFPTLEECKAWMALTQSKVYVQYIEAEG